jgi:C-terminal processing protease CtpA/Prc
VLVVPDRTDYRLVEPVPSDDSDEFPDEGPESPFHRLEILRPEQYKSFFEPLTWGHKPRLGVQLVETTPELREHLGGTAEAGVLVSKILSGMPAQKAGLLVGDLIVSVDGEPVASSNDLILALQDKVGETFDVEIVRDRRTRTLEVTIPEPETDRPTGPRA